MLIRFAKPIQMLRAIRPVAIFFFSANFKQAWFATKKKMLLSEHLTWS